MHVELHGWAFTPAQTALLCLVVMAFAALLIAAPLLVSAQQWSDRIEPIAARAGIAIAALLGVLCALDWWTALQAVSP